MPSIILLPPIVVALYLVVISWASFYQKPDIIVIPGVFETITLVIGFGLSALIYWLVILPAAYVILKSGKSAYGGLLLGVIMAVGLTLIATVSGPDFSWRGTVSLDQVYYVIIPMLYLSVHGYSLLRRHLLKKTNPPFVPWGSPVRFHQLVIGLLIAGAVITVIGMSWNRLPVVSMLNIEQRDEDVAGGVLLQAPLQVVHSLLDKPGGYLSNDRLPPGRALDNVYYWEQGVQTAARHFSELLDSYNYFIDLEEQTGPISEEARLTPVTPEELLRANRKLRDAMTPEQAGKAESLYKDALADLAAARSRLAPARVNILNNGNLRGWLDKTVRTLGELSGRLERDSQNIALALKPDRYSPRRPALLAIQPLWKENNALYQAYGTATALTLYLRAIEISYRDQLESKGGMPMLQSALTSMEQCLPEAWTPLLLPPGGIQGLRNDIDRVQPHINQAVTALFELRQLL